MTDMNTDKKRCIILNIYFCDQITENYTTWVWNEGKQILAEISILSETILDRGLPLNKRTTACAKNVETAENPVTTRVYFLH